MIFAQSRFGFPRRRGTERQWEVEDGGRKPVWLFVFFPTLHLLHLIFHWPRASTNIIMTLSQQWVGPRKAVNAEPAQRLRGRTLLWLELWRKRGSWAAACLQMLTKSNNGAFEETVVRGHCHGSPLAIGPDAGASKLTRAWNKLDVWSKYVALHATQGGVGSGTPTAVQDGLRTPPGTSWNCGLQFGSPAAKICGYKVPSSSGLQFGSEGQNGCTHQKNMVVGDICGLQFCLTAAWHTCWDLHSPSKEWCMMHGRPNQRSRGAEFECTHLLENICTVVGSQFGMAEARLKHRAAHSLGEGCCTAVIPLVMIIIRLPPFLFALICLLACPLNSTSCFYYKQSYFW